MDFTDIAHLQELLDPDGEQSSDVVQNPSKGSIFTPGDIGGSGAKEIAKPFAQVAVKGGRNNNQPEDPVEQQQQTKKKQEVKTNNIWEDDEILSVPKSNQETRIRPEVTVLYKQAVGVEDVYGGWSGIDPSSTTCQFLLVKISLPGSKFSEISLEVQKQVLVAQSTRYYLNFPLPYPVNDKEGKAKWITDKSTLEITLPIHREDPF